MTAAQPSARHVPRSTGHVPSLAEVFAGLGVVSALLDQHRPDHHGDCHACSHSQSGPVKFPCTLRKTAEQAQRIEAGPANT